MGNNTGKIKHNLSAAEKQALRSLQENNSIVICKADKGGVVVVLNKCDYDNEVSCQLINESHYRKIENDPSIQMRNEIKIFLYSAVMKGIITEDTYDLLFWEEARIPHIYFSPKIHKSLIKPPGRPIVSNLSSLLQHLAIDIDIAL